MLQGWLTNLKQYISLGSYRWGIECKRKLLNLESQNAGILVFSF